jgi:hypothetical protein
MTQMALSSQYDLLPASSSSPCALLEGQSNTKDVFIYLSAETGSQDLRYKKHEWRAVPTESRAQVAGTGHKA